MLSLVYKRYAETYPYLDISYPKFFEDDEVSMPLMDPEDYFMRGWALDILTPTKFTLEVRDQVMQEHYITVIVGSDINL